jgi:hypothetical protein
VLLTFMEAPFFRFPPTRTTNDSSPRGFTRVREIGRRPAVRWQGELDHVRRHRLVLLACGVLAPAAIAPTGCASSRSPRSEPAGLRSAARPTGRCDLRATPATFDLQVVAASAGQTICLGAGSYGTWSGTAKRITVIAAHGGTASMRVAFGSGARGFTVIGMSGMGGTIRGGAADIAIVDSSFTSTIDIEGAISHVVLSRDSFNWNARSTPAGPNAKVFVDVQGTLSAPALTISDSTIRNGDLDGVHVGGGSGAQIVGNRFEDLCDRNINHTDNIQLESGTQIRIAGNYVYAPQSCPTQGITSYDGGTNGLVIEDNVVDIPRDWGIELYSDHNSIVRHNTVVWHSGSYSEFGTGTGRIDIDRKSQDPVGSGTRVYDNIATSVSFADGSSGTGYDNLSGQWARYVGPLSSWKGYRLSRSSPVGVRAASDGHDDGVLMPAARAP